MSSSSPFRRLHHFTSCVLIETTPVLSSAYCAGQSLLDAEGEAAVRFGGAKVVILEIGQRGAPLMKSADADDDKLIWRGLAPVFVRAVEDIPPDTTIIVTTGAAVGTDILARAPSLKLVASALTGVDHIDVKECASRKIRVCNVPNYSTEATAQLAIGLILSHLNRLPQCHKTILDGNWAGPAQDDICEKNVGIVGVGRIGMRLAELFKAFRVKGLCGYDLKWQESDSPFIQQLPAAPLGPYGSARSVVRRPQVVQDSSFAALNGVISDSLAGIFLNSDIVCICIPLTDKTQGLISEALMKLLRPNSLLVNVSRGGVVDEAALAKLLIEGHFRAALDVFGVEPLPKESPLRSVAHDKLIMTPHVGHQSPASLEKRLDATVKNILSFVAGQAQNIVA